jgi:hypothetical protein
LALSTSIRTSNKSRPGSVILRARREAEDFFASGRLPVAKFEADPVQINGYFVKVIANEPVSPDARQEEPAKGVLDENIA